MPCSKCKADFNLRTWKLKCKECSCPHCTNCLKRQQGALFCDKCIILNKRPPDRDQLNELRSKDLQDYLNRHDVSTHGLVEKAELVELFFMVRIPNHNSRRGASRGRLNSLLNSGSLPDIAVQSQEHIQNIRENINNIRTYAENALHNLGRTVGPAATDETQPEPVTSAQPQTVDPTPRYPKLSDFGSVEELNGLPIKQLKELLTLNRVDYKGCVEKGELLERAAMLWLDHKNNEQTDPASRDHLTDNLCKICMDAALDCVLLECGHVVTCVDCGKRLAECPICRQYVTRVVRTFKA